MTDYALTAAENKQGWQDRVVAPALDSAVLYLTAAAPCLCCLKPNREHSNADKVMMWSPDDVYQIDISWFNMLSPCCQLFQVQQAEYPKGKQTSLYFSKKQQQFTDLAFLRKLCAAGLFQVQRELGRRICQQRPRGKREKLLCLPPHLAVLWASVGWRGRKNGKMNEAGAAVWPEDGHCVSQHSRTMVARESY